MTNLATALPLRYYVDSIALPGGLSAPLATFPGRHPTQGSLGEVCLHIQEETGSLFVSYPKFSLLPKDHGMLVREVCPIPAGFLVKKWGKAEQVQCHTEDPEHPWNIGSEKPGYHRCGACGYPTFIEVHGYSAGHCERCGYHG